MSHTNQDIIGMKRELYMGSLYHFAKYCLGYKEMTVKTHGPMARALQESTLRKMLCVPRGTFKSSLGTVAYTMWRLLHNPNERILIDSEKYTNAKNFLREITSHYVNNQEFIDCFGNWIGPLWNEGEAIVKTRTKALKEPSIACSGIGAGKTSQHYDCLVKGSMIYTSNGFKKIENINVGNKVLANDGKFHSVTHKKKNDSGKKILKIRSSYQVKSLELTEDHKVYAYIDGVFGWIEAKELTKEHMLCFPKITGRTRSISKVNKEIDRLLSIESFWRFIGYWLAEGCNTTNCKNGVRLSFGAHEKDYIKDCCDIIKQCVGIDPSISKVTKSNTVLIIFSHKEIKEILSKFGTHAYNKSIPPFVLNAYANKQRQLLIGYHRGDGSYTKSNGAVSFSSTSYDLLFGIQMMLASKDIASGISQSRKEGKSLVVGNLCNIKDAFNLTSTSDALKAYLNIQYNIEWKEKPIRSFFTDKYWVVPISSIEESENKDDVYDITVRDRHSFVTQAGIVHNCIIADDLSSYENTMNPDVAQKTINHYRQYISLLEPDGTIVIIGTRYSEIDIIGFVLKNELGIEDLKDLKRILSEEKKEQKS